MSSQGSRNETAAAVNGPDPASASSRERKLGGGGGVVKTLKSRRIAAERRPVTEDELRAADRAITPEEVLALRSVTRGKHFHDITLSWVLFLDRFQQVKRV